MQYVQDGAEREARAGEVVPGPPAVHRGVEHAREPLAGLTAGEHAPGAKADDDEALRAWIRGNVGTAFHPSCSAAMGGSDEAVCDPELRVRGVSGLRVDRGAGRRPHPGELTVIPIAVHSVQSVVILGASLALVLG